MKPSFDHVIHTHMSLLCVAIMNNAMLITAFYYYHDDSLSTSQSHDIMKLGL